MAESVSEELVTCPSCEYRYVRSEGTCVMCGTAAPVAQPLMPAPMPAPEFSGPAEASASTPKAASQGLAFAAKLAVLLAFIGAALYATFLHQERNDTALQSSPAPELPTPVVGMHAENFAGSQIVPVADKAAPQKAAVLQPSPKTEQVTRDNAVDLWKAVKHGDINAEVALANLYLKGESVPQSCEQARLLLVAAAMKGSRDAGNSLKNTYAERCE